MSASPAAPPSTATVRLALADARDVLLKPATAIPRVLALPGLDFVKVSVGAYLLLALLFHFIAARYGLKASPGLGSVLKQLFGEVVFVAALFGAVHVGVRSMVKRMDVTTGQIANVTAIALVPATAVTALMFILAFAAKSLIVHMSWLLALAPGVFLMASLFVGLRLNVRSAIYTTLGAMLVACLLQSFVSGGGVAGTVKRQQSIDSLRGYGVEVYRGPTADDSDGAGAGNEPGDPPMSPNEPVPEPTRSALSGYDVPPPAESEAP